MRTSLTNAPTTEGILGLACAAIRWLFIPFVLYLASGTLVLIAICLAVRIANPATSSSMPSTLLLNALGQLDGGFYERILLDGYTHSRHEGGTTVFFPGYPWMAWVVYDCGVPARWSLLITSWASLLGALVLAQFYVNQRLSKEPVPANLALAALALNPMAFHMWFMYSEATFLFLLVLLLAFIERGASPVVVAAVCGALTGVRSAGVAAIPVAIIYAWVHRPGLVARSVNISLTLALCAWGLALFAWRMHMDFGDPLAFVHAQEAFDPLHRTLAEKCWSLATLGPLRRLLDSTSTGYGFPRHAGLPGLFSNQIGDALCWLVFGILIAVGGWKRWLNWQELLLAVLLFAFSTWFQADRSDMACQGRYMSVIFPAYIVAGRLLAGMPWEVRLGLAAVAAGLFVNYATTFATGGAV